MKKIRLAYRLVIDESSRAVWNRYVFDNSYQEYLLQHQKFNDKEKPANTFRDLLSKNPKAEQLHFLVGGSISGYIDQLQGRLGNVSDVLGKHFFPIGGYQLDIVDTDILNKSKHKIGITFFSDEMILLDIINNCYLVSTETSKQNNFETIMFPIIPNMSICYYELL